MNQEIKTKWTEALRSGKYKQAKNKLRTIEGHCCLGVLCDLYIEETGNGGWNKSDDLSYTFKPNKSFYVIGILPDEVYRWARLYDRNPEIPIKDPNIYDGELYPRLSDINDRGYSFEQIANLIEEHL